MHEHLLWDLDTKCEANPQSSLRAGLGPPGTLSVPGCLPMSSSSSPHRCRLPETGREQQAHCLLKSCRFTAMLLCSLQSIFLATSGEEAQGTGLLASLQHAREQLLCLSPDASFQRQTVWFLYTFAFSVCQALKCLSSWSILNDNMHLRSSSSSNERGPP